MRTAIEFNNISKQYRLGLVSTRTISHDLNRWWKMNILGKEDPYLKIGEVNDRAHKGESEYVWALKDINFKVEQGDVLGIIGKNGAGKSTLLKILSKVTAPTTGTIKARGRIASLLEVGTGFHPEMTGRENIFMNGAIMGMTKAEIARKLDEIVDFAGVERYIDTPVKRYSSGMTVRLGFAIAAHLEPEILVVDEVLAVGDAEFQKKAIGKMQDVSKGEGRTVLFVSHNMGAVRNLCSKGLVLENGQIIFLGTTNDAIDNYIYVKKNSDLLKVDAEAKVKKNRLKGYSNEVFFKEIFLDKSNGNYCTNEDIVFICKIKSNRTTENVRINATISNIEDTPIGGWFGDGVIDIKEGEEKLIKISLKNHNLSIGTYFISLSLGKGNFIEGMIDFDVVMMAEKFSVVGFDVNSNTGFTTWQKQWGHILFTTECEVLD
ncbi:MAG: ABC transporter ATP-binding protein [Porphyromonadaceae bacterium]|jgi:lipopolysaccharide transport system ATP-binding protein|nr:ABC transporter ATP-binding protein [Porphyromonadaceae bacterium]